MRYGATRKVDDIHYAVAVAQLVSNATPFYHSSKPEALHMVGVALQTRFEHLGKLRDLDTVITVQRVAAELTLDGDPLKAASLSSLGSAQKDRFQRFGDTKDLEMAVSNLRRAVDLTPHGDPGRLSRLNNYSISLHTLFRRLGNLADLDASIAGMKEVVRLTPDGDPEKPSRLSNLGLAQRARSGRIGTLDDLKESVVNLTHAANLTPDTDPDKPSILNNLSIALQTNFERFGALEDADGAISAMQKAVELTPDHHPTKPALSSNLAVVLKARFARLGTIDDLQEAITAMKRGVDTTPDGHPDKPTWLSNLGDALRAKYNHLGALEDLETAISYQNKAVKLLPRGNAEEHGRLATLGLMYYARFLRLHVQRDLDMAIEIFERAVSLTPDGHPEKPSRFGNLGIAQYARFERLGTIEDLEKAITHHSETVRLVPDGHQDRPAHLNNHGIALLARFQRTGILADLEKAAASLALAVKLTSDGDPEKPSRLNNLAITHRERYRRLEKREDIDASISVLHRAIELTPEEHPMRVMLLANTGKIYFTRLSSPYSKPHDSVVAINFLSSALTAKSGNPFIKLEVGRILIRILSTPGLPQTTTAVTLELYQLVLDLVPEIVWLGHDVNQRYKELTNLGTLANHAAAAAIAAGQYARAIGWLESGRSIVWSQILRLRSPLDDLRNRHPKLAVRLDRVTQALRQGTSAGAVDGVLHESQATPDSNPQSQYSIAIEYDNLIAEIRGLRGFEDFMRPKPFSQLTSVSSSGHVVVVNIDESRCDALILHGAGDVVHVPLSSFSFERAEALRKMLREMLGTLHLLERRRDMPGDIELEEKEERGGRTGRYDKTAMYDVLAELWRDMVKPVLDEIIKLASSCNDKTLPRIIWCPTGPLVFLPLHAAGIYRDKGSQESVLDFAVSSYTPTLEALLRAPSRQIPSGESAGTSRKDGSRKILVVSHPGTPGTMSHIPNTEVEAQLIHTIFPSSTSIISGDKSTVDVVLKAMATHDWIHLACHGVQNSQDPIQSAFALYDGPLKLSMLMDTELVNAELAVLSACQTATGDKNLSEEAVHLAAAMLNVGFKSVIGTMWSISDNTAPRVARAFYEALREQVANKEMLQPAYALHGAIQKIRHREELHRWVPFVHFGL
ncbi:CHAT domain-containing protein [Irpex rosettiformis]|uniref:CHAT domain-containing protein n=1 Tax=Irpex rosettiformis TaxID=378272 RepID=A0ACB8U3V9_9APHY|nr:CHAT domain-containing protein [Irpex rosettiformis]